MWFQHKSYRDRVLGAQGDKEEFEEDCIFVNLGEEYEDSEGEGEEESFDTSKIPEGCKFVPLSKEVKKGM